MDIQLALGQALIALPQPDPPHKDVFERIRKARCMFHNILKKCNGKGSYKTVDLSTKVQEQTPGTSASNRMANSQTGEQNSISNRTESMPNGAENMSTNGATNTNSEKTMDRRGDERKASKWFQLEINAAAEMIVLADSYCDFLEATKVYDQVMRQFNDKPIEVFKGFKL